MSNDMKSLFKSMLKYDIAIGIIFTVILSFIFGVHLASIFLLGLIVAIANFISSGVILEKALSGGNWIKGILFPLSFIIRIIVIIVIAIPFLNDVKSIVIYIFGFIMHFPILIISWVKKQKGSE